MILRRPEYPNELSDVENSRSSPSKEDAEGEGELHPPLGIATLAVIFFGPTLAEWYLTLLR